VEKDVNGVMVERRRVKVTGGDVLYDPKVMLLPRLRLGVTAAGTGQAVHYDQPPAAAGGIGVNLGRPAAC
jgi:hypothetical protein